MRNIVVSGSLFDIANKLGRMKQVIAYRVNVGYAPFQHDENWQYQTAQDERVCEVCAPRHGNLYRGDYLVSDFTFYVSVETKKVEIHDHIRCRCDAEWLNLHEVLVERLAIELEAA